MAKPSATLSNVTSAFVSMCSAFSRASPRMSDSAIVKQPAWAAPINSSGFVPGLPSKRLVKPYGYLSSAPLFVEMAPLPPLIPPSQTAVPNVIIFHPSLGFGQRRRERPLSGLWCLALVPGASRLVSFGMPESDIEERTGLTVRAAAVKQVAEDVVGLDRRPPLDIAQHRGCERRAGRGEHSPRSFEKFRARRKTLHSRDRTTFVEEPRGKISSAGCDNVTDRSAHQAGDPCAGRDK